MSKLTDLLAKLKSGDVPSYSTMDIINEKRQEIPKGVAITRFAYEFQKNARILFRLQMALPFNPETGEPDETFNPERKWRPPLSPTTAAKVIKVYAKANEKTKNLLMARAGASEWNVDDPETLTPQDMKILREYRVPLVITAEAITINDAGVTGQDFAISYSVPIKRDLTTGQIVGEVPPIAKIGNFMSAVTFAEIRELEDAIKSKDPMKYKNERPFINRAAIPAVDEPNKKDWISKILNDAIISSVRPQNYLMAYEFRLSPNKSMRNDEGNPLPVFTSISPEDIKAKQVYFNYAKKYKEPILKTLSNPALDVFWDFVEYDICDSSATEPKDKQAKMEASRSLSPATPSHSFWDLDNLRYRFEWVTKLLGAISEFADSDPNYEEKMAMFVARQLRPLDDRVIGAVSDRIQEKIPLSNRYVTDTILKAHKDACIVIYEQDYTDALIERNLITAEAAVPAENAKEKAEIENVANLIKEINETNDDENGEPQLPDATDGIGPQLPDATDGIAAEEITV